MLIARQLFYNFRHTGFEWDNLTREEKQIWTPQRLAQLKLWIIKREGDTVG